MSPTPALAARADVDCQISTENWPPFTQEGAVHWVVHRPVHQPALDSVSHGAYFDN